MLRYVERYPAAFHLVASTMNGIKKTKPPKTIKMHLGTKLETTQILPGNFNCFDNSSQASEGQVQQCS